MRKFVVAIGLANILSGSALALPAQQATIGEYQKAYSDDYEKSFRAAFRTNSVEQCVASAPKAATAGYDVTPTCTCAADTVLATHTVEQLKDLTADALQPVVTRCLETNPPLRSKR